MQTEQQRKPTFTTVALSYLTGESRISRPYSVRPAVSLFRSGLLEATRVPPGLESGLGFGFSFRVRVRSRSALRSTASPRLWADDAYAFRHACRSLTSALSGATRRRSLETVFKLPNTAVRAGFFIPDLMGFFVCQLLTGQLSMRTVADSLPGLALSCHVS